MIETNNEEQQKTTLVPKLELNITQVEHNQVLSLVSDCMNFEADKWDSESWHEGLKKIFGATVYQTVKDQGGTNMKVHDVPHIPYITNGKTIKRYT